MGNIVFLNEQLCLKNKTSFKRTKNGTKKTENDADYLSKKSDILLTTKKFIENDIFLR